MKFVNVQEREDEEEKKSMKASFLAVLQSYVFLNA